MTLSEPNASDACRLCDENKDKMYSIFHKNPSGKQIINLIKEYLPLIVFRTDPLSKQICEKCMETLENFNRFKQHTVEIAEKHVASLRSATNHSRNIQLYLSLDGEDLNHSSENSVRSTKSTSTDDLIQAAFNTAEIPNGTGANAERISESDAEKATRTRRKRSQAFYHELDDSLCSSLTEFTNTESSQYECNSEEDSCEFEAKRRKLNEPIEPEKPENSRKFQEEFMEIYRNEAEFKYHPLSLLKLTLNVINTHIVPTFEPDDFYVSKVTAHCFYCKAVFNNTKLLSMHEIDHITIEAGEKVDSPSLWEDSREDAAVRNKWLHTYDEESDSAEAMELEMDSLNESLLIPVGTEIPEQDGLDSIQIVNTIATVNGIALSDYAKDQRKAFYKSIKVGAVNRKFCPLCRYSFKDNWAIESHYFSSACHFTCRYCGMRYNKQRQRFQEHVQEHVNAGHKIATKVFVASKNNNFVPTVPRDRSRKAPQPSTAPSTGNQQHQTPEVKERVAQPLRVKNFPVKKVQQQQNALKIKEEVEEDDFQQYQGGAGGRGGKATNQAYFCRKCYKVFFKLDEFNVHSKNCELNNQMGGGGGQQKTGGGTTSAKAPTTNGADTPMVSPSGRPMRNCVRDIATYKDEVRIADKSTKNMSPTQQNFVCFVCNTPFPTIYSRNSHMRIHKGDPTRTSSTGTKTRPKGGAAKPKSASYSHFIKQEPLEPEVQIHESEHSYTAATPSIGAVSITPISKNPNQKATINPNIMKLVKNNPHLTIKANHSPERQVIGGNSAQNSTSPDGDKTYKCSSCWLEFGDKSQLYFHKKNECGGSKYPCPFCKKRFGTESAYSSHIFYSHPE